MNDLPIDIATKYKCSYIDITTEPKRIDLEIQRVIVYLMLDGGTTGPGFTSISGYTSTGIDALMRELGERLSEFNRSLDEEDIIDNVSLIKDQTDRGSVSLYVSITTKDLNTYNVGIVSYE